MKPHPYQITLTFLLYPSEDSPDRMVAHCLEFDAVAVEDTPEKAILLLKELIDDLMSEAIKDGTVDELFHPAPAEYWKMLANAREYVAPEKVRRRHIRAKPIGRVGYAMAYQGSVS